MTGAPIGGGLPRRDLLLLPLVAALTIVLMAVVGEAGCRIMFPASDGISCRVSDPVLGYRNRPNCSDTLKAFEGERVVNDYNDCGYRTAQSCRPDPAGASRISLIGSSVAGGHFVGYADSIGAQVGDRLSRACHRPVDVQNLAGPEYYLKQIRARTTEALALKPAVLLWVLTPFDIQTGDADPPTLVQTAQAGPPPPLLVRLHGLALESRAFAVMQHLYYEKISNYVPLFLLNQDKAGFLYRRYTPVWQQRIAFLGQITGAIAGEAKAAGVPFVVAFVPQRAQAAMAGMPQPATIDPYALNHAIQRIVESNGAHFVDTTPSLARTGIAGSLYLPLDGHLDPHGHRIAGRTIADQLMAADLREFSQCQPTSSTASASIGDN